MTYERRLGYPTERQEFRAQALAEQDGRCHYCKSIITERTATADHKWPVSRKGRTTKANIAAACENCNKAKGSLSHIEMYRLTKKGQPPRNTDFEFLLIWATRRIMKRAKVACSRIERQCA